MTADDVRGVVFQKATIGGYKQSDVDMFLDEVAVCIESMTAKIRSLEKAKFDAGATKSQTFEAPKPNEAPITPKKEEPKNDTITDYGLQSLLIRAQQLADQIQSEAKEAAEQLLAQTTEDAKEIIAKADLEAQETIDKANQILAEAENKEASINSAAKREAENIINEAVARSGQMLTATRDRLKNEQEMCERLRSEFNQVKNVIVGFYEDQLDVINKMSVTVTETVTENATEILEESEPTYEASDEEDITTETIDGIPEVEEAEEQEEFEEISSNSSEENVQDVALDFNLS